MTEQERDTEQSCQHEDQSSEKLAALEAVLFMAAEPIPSAELAEILEVTPEQADLLLRQLEAACERGGIQVTRVADGYQVCTRPEYGPYVAKLHKPERFRLSRPALETLAIVAYKQPVTRPEVEAIRGVNSDSPIDTLAQYELICEAGRKDTPGRPVLYRTTDNFLGHFGLNSVEDLPQLDSIPVDETEAGTEASSQVDAGPADQPQPDPEAAGETPETGEQPSG